MLNIDQSCRLFNYVGYKVTDFCLQTLKSIDDKLMHNSYKAVRIALSAIAFFVSAVIGCLGSWQWIVTGYVAHALLDMFLEPRKEQRWDEIVYQGINIGLSARVAYIVLNSLFHFSVGGIAQGVLLGAAIFFKNDWDQHDWSRVIIWGRSESDLKEKSPLSSATFLS